MRKPDTYCVFSFPLRFSKSWELLEIQEGCWLPITVQPRAVSLCLQSAEVPSPSPPFWKVVLYPRLSTGAGPALPVIYAPFPLHHPLRQGPLALKPSSLVHLFSHRLFPLPPFRLPPSLSCFSAFPSRRQQGVKLGCC